MELGCSPSADCKQDTTLEVMPLSAEFCSWFASSFASSWSHCIAGPVPKHLRRRRRSQADNGYRNDPASTQCDFTRGCACPCAQVLHEADARPATDPGLAIGLGPARGTYTLYALLAPDGPTRGSGDFAIVGVFLFDAVKRTFKYRTRYKAAAQHTVSTDQA